MSRLSRPALTLLLLAAGLWALAAGVRVASDRFLGTPSLLVNVRWVETLEPGQRGALERQFGLTSAKLKDGTTYSYYLRDASRTTIRALVQHPSVADTHHIDRSAFEPSPSAEWTYLDPQAEARAGQVAALLRYLRGGAAAILAVGLFVLIAPRWADVVWRLLRTSCAGVIAAIERSIPLVSAQQAAAFRICFGTALVAACVWTGSGATSVPAAVPAASGVLMEAAGGVFVDTPTLANWVTPWIVVTGALFIAGVFPRATFAALAIGVWAWSVLHSLRYGHHPVSALLVAIVCLLAARWSPAWSVMPHRGGSAPARAREYGYAIWVPGVVIGCAFAAAAAAKLREGGIDWVLNGTVKYHFLTDAYHAPVDWGVRYALTPGVAVALSFAAMVVETLMLPVALFGRGGLRVAAGMAAAGLLVGFYIFQGLFWPGWWILLLSFVPWQLFVRHGESPAPAPAYRRALAYAQGGVLVAVLVQQVIVSASKSELAPILSTYDMYSSTYESPEVYEQRAEGVHWLVVATTDARTLRCRLSETQVRMMAAAAPDGFGSEPAKELVSRCVGLDEISTLAVETERPRVDWAAGRHLGTTRKRVAGPVAWTAAR